MGFDDAFADGFSRYAKFSGRSSKPQFWYWLLASGLVFLSTNLFDKWLFAEPIIFLYFEFFVFWISVELGWIGILAFLVLFLPTLTVSVRRLHDLDRRGWWLLLGVIPVLGSIVLLIWFCFTGTPGHNRYGPDPVARGSFDGR